MKKVNGARGSIKPYTPMKAIPVRDTSYKPDSAGIYRPKVHADAAMKAGDKPENYITAVPWGGDPFAGDQIAAQKTIIFRPTKQQLDMTTAPKKTPVNMKSGISGIGSVQPDKNNLKFMAKNVDRVPISAIATADIKTQHSIPILPKNAERDNIEKQAGLEHSYMEKIEPDQSQINNYKQTQEYVPAWAEAFPEQQDFTPVYPEEYYPSRKVTVEPDDYDAGYVYETDTKIEYHEQSRAKNNIGVEVYAQQNYEDGYLEDGNVQYDRNQVQNKKNQNRVENLNADAQYDDGYVEYEQPRQNRRYQASVDNLQANAEQEVYDNEYVVENQNRRRQVEVENLRADGEYYIDDNEYYSVKQNKKHQVEMQNRRADKNNYNTNDNEYEIEEQNRAYQAEMSSQQAEKDLQVNNYERNYQKNQTPKYNSTVNNLKAERQHEDVEQDRPAQTRQIKKTQNNVNQLKAEIEIGRAEVEKKEGKNNRKYQANLNAARSVPKTEDMASNVSEIKEVKQTKKQQGEKEAHMAQPEHDVRIAIPNMRFTKKQETDTNRPIINTRIMDGDSKVRIQVALEKSRKQQSAQPNEEHSNIQVSQNGKLEQEVERQNVSHSAKPDSSTAQITTNTVEPRIEQVDSQRRQYSAKPETQESNVKFYDNNKIEEHDATSITELK